MIEDGPEENSSKLLSTPFVEDPQHRLKWVAYLEFTHNEEVEDLTWDKVSLSLLFDGICLMIITLDKMHFDSTELAVSCLTLKHFVLSSLILVSMFMARFDN